MEINSKVKRKLRSLAHSIKPSVIIGKDGLTKGSISSIDNCLESKELIKVKFLFFKDQKNEISNKIESILNATVVGKIGNIVILFRQCSNQDERKFII